MRRSRTPHPVAPALFLCAVMLFAIESRAQETAEPADTRLRLGVHVGMQSRVLRYSVFPYSGEFQSTAEHGTVKGISVGIPLAHALRMQIDLAWWSHAWNVRQSGDPLVEIDRGTRAFIEFPVLLVYRPTTLPVPLYLAAGPALALLTGEKPAFTVSYTSFSERDGWTTSRREFVEDRLHFAVTAEAGIDAPLTDMLAVQLGVRYTQPLRNAIDEETLTLRELSVWRIRLGLLWTL